MGNFPNLDISLVDPQRIARRQGISVPALLKSQHVIVGPYGRMGQPGSALGHYLDKVAGTVYKIITYELPDFLKFALTFKSIFCNLYP
jgi:hypothetical protein